MKLSNFRDNYSSWLKYPNTCIWSNDGINVNQNFLHVIYIDYLFIYECVFLAVFLNENKMSGVQF